MFAQQLLISASLTVASLGAYEVIEVTEGGAITGAVTFQGTPPEPGRIQVSKHQDVCGTYVTDGSLLVSGTNGLANVVIALQGAERGKAPNEKPTLDNKNCMFVPRIQAMMGPSKLLIVNSDSVLHNVHGYLGDVTLFNLALPMENQKLEKKLRRPGILSVKCDVHPWMQAYVVVSENPYHAVTDSNGQYEIRDIPPGTYTLTAWHEALGEQTMEVTVQPNGTTKAEYAFGPE